MFGPGAYVSAPTEGMVDLKDLPAPQLVPSSRNQQSSPYPRGDALASRHTSGPRTWHDLGDISTGRPVDLLVTDSSPYCAPCQKYCNIAVSDVAPPGGHSPHRGPQVAVRLVVEAGVPSRPTSWPLGRDHRVCVPFATIQNWVEAGGKQGPRAEGPYVSGLGA